MNHVADIHAIMERFDEQDRERKTEPVICPACLCEIPLEEIPNRGLYKFYSTSMGKVISGCKDCFEYEIENAI